MEKIFFFRNNSDSQLSTAFELTRESVSQLNIEEMIKVLRWLLAYPEHNPLITGLIYELKRLIRNQTEWHHIAQMDNSQHILNIETLD